MSSDNNCYNEERGSALLTDEAPDVWRQRARKMPLPGFRGFVFGRIRVSDGAPLPGTLYTDEDRIAARERALGNVTYSDCDSGTDPLEFEGLEE